MDFYVYYTQPETAQIFQILRLHLDQRNELMMYTLLSFLQLNKHFQ